MVKALNKTLVIYTKDKSDVISKVFGVIRRQDYVIENFLVNRNENSTLLIIITVKESISNLPFEYLIKQIEKLIDVTGVLCELNNNRN